jgi:translocation and assembly module TamB
LHPFAQDALGEVNLTARAVNVAQFRSTLPQTNLDLDLTLKNGVGRLSMTNRDAGLYGDGKIPLAQLQAAFRQRAGRLDIEKISGKLGTPAQPAGLVSGSGQYADGALNLTLDLKAVDLHRLDQRLQASKLNGPVEIKHEGDRQALTAELTEPFGKKTIALSAQATMADERVTVERAVLTLGQGNLTASGKLDLSGRGAFSAEGTLSHFQMQQLGQFGALPASDLNGNFSLSGERQPSLTADLKFDIDDSQVGGQALRGAGQAGLRGNRLLVPALSVVVGANRLEVHGELSQDNGQLLFSVDAPNLSQFGSDFGGALQANGNAHGSFKEPHIDMAWSANKLELPGQSRIGQAQGKAAFTVDRTQPLFIKTVTLDASAKALENATQKLAALDAHVQFSPRANAPLAINVQGDTLAAAQFQVDHFAVTASGTTAKHLIAASTEQSDQKWTLNAGGGIKGLSDAIRWQGSIDSLVGAGQVAGHLAGSAPLTVSRQRVQLDHFLFDANDGQIAIDKFVRDQKKIVTRGSFKNLQIMPLLQLAAQQPVLKSDLQLTGEWNIDLADSLNGTIQVRRQSGDVVMKGSSTVPLGLQNLEASAQATNGHVSLHFVASGQKLGTVDMSAGAKLAGGANRFAIAPHAPLSGSAKLDMPSLNWVGSLISPSLIVEGRLHSAVSVSGTYASPRLAGSINGDGLRLFFLEQGIDLRHGLLEGEFKNDGLIVRQLRFQSPDGDATLAGPVNWTEGKAIARLTLNADRFVLFNRIDRRLVVSGQSQIDWNDTNVPVSGEPKEFKSQLKVNGAFTVDSGFFDLGKGDSPGLSDDVVIVGRKQKQAARVATDLNVDIGLGDGITLQGRGLDAVLTGKIHVTSDPGMALLAHGTLDVTKGTYSAYGKKLAIEKGELLFNGPIANPALDILAMQRGQQVAVGVAVSGTVLAPRVTLVSEPPLPDTEKLSWLVLGHGLDTAGGTDLSALQAAAGALLAGRGSGGTQSQLASTFGLDEINVTTDQSNAQQRVVTFGKRLSSKLEVSYEQGIESVSSVLHLRYTLSKRLSLEGEAGTRSAISIFFNFLFD